MVVNNIFGPLVMTFIYLSNSAFCSVQIDDLIVPEAVAVDNDATIECIYSGITENFTVRWRYNGMQFYEWRSGTEPRINGILDDRIALFSNTNKRQVLKLTKLSPDLSGLYTCAIHCQGREVLRSKAMMVYSTERDFQLLSKRGTLKCIVKGVYPQPVLTIELHNIPIAQEQRIWKNGSFFDAECVARASTSILKYEEIVCRLQIPEIDYTAIIKKNISNSVNGVVRNFASTIFITSYILLLNNNY